MTRDLEFSFRGMAVGCFEAVGYPKSPGSYHYMPYRSYGHLSMHNALAFGQVRCAFREGGSAYEFVVLSEPEHGVLVIQSIRPRPWWKFWR